MNQNMFDEYYPYMFLTFGLVALAVSVFLESSKRKLMQTGILVEGIIYEQGYSNSTNSSFAKDEITVRFVTQSQEWITAVIEQNFQLSYTKQYKDGETVKVYYDKDNPSHFYVDTKQSELLGRVIVGLVGLIFISIGLYKIFT